MGELSFIANILLGYTLSDQGVWVQFIQMPLQWFCLHALSIWDLVCLVDHRFYLSNANFIKAVFIISTIIKTIILIGFLLNHGA